MKTLTPRQAAVRLGCGMKRVYELLYAGKISARKVRNRWEIPASEVEVRMKQRESRNV